MNNKIITEKEKQLESRLAEKLSELSDMELSVIIGLIDGLVIAKQMCKSDPA